jgi:hypothetical protein
VINDGNSKKGTGSAQTPSTAGALTAEKAANHTPKGCEFGVRRNGTIWMSFASPLVGGHYQADFDFPEGIAALVARSVNSHAELVEALESIAGFGSIDLSAEWESGLRDIIRSCVDAARAALSKVTGGTHG